MSRKVLIIFALGVVCLVIAGWLDLPRHQERTAQELKRALKPVEVKTVDGGAAAKKTGVLYDLKRLSKDDATDEEEEERAADPDREDVDSDNTETIETGNDGEESGSGDSTVTERADGEWWRKNEVCEQLGGDYNRPEEAREGVNDGEENQGAGGTDGTDTSDNVCSDLHPFRREGDVQSGNEGKNKGNADKEWDIGSTGNAGVDEAITEEKELTYLGTWTATAYCSCPVCCGEYATGYTASGTLATEGRTVACNILPFGTQLMIGGNIYTVEDTGWSPYGESWIDIFFDSHDSALAYGVREVEVYLVN